MIGECYKPEADRFIRESIQEKIHNQHRLHTLPSLPQNTDKIAQNKSDSFMGTFARNILRNIWRTIKRSSTEVVQLCFPNLKNPSQQFSQNISTFLNRNRCSVYFHILVFRYKIDSLNPGPSVPTTAM